MQTEIFWKKANWRGRHSWIIYEFLEFRDRKSHSEFRFEFGQRGKEKVQFLRLDSSRRNVSSDENMTNDNIWNFSGNPSNNISEKVWTDDRWRAHPQFQPTAVQTFCRAVIKPTFLFVRFFLLRVLIDFELWISRHDPTRFLDSFPIRPEQNTFPVFQNLL